MAVVKKMMTLPNILAIVIIGVIMYLISTQIYEHYYLEDEPKLNELRDIFTKFFRQKRKWPEALEPLNRRDIMSETRLYRGNKSYNIGKERIYLCLKDENGNYFDHNSLIFVLAHEYSHTICEDEYDHTEKFFRIHKALLEELAKAGIYDPNKPVDDMYCVNGDAEVPE